MVFDRLQFFDKKLQKLCKNRPVLFVIDFESDGRVVCLLPVLKVERTRMQKNFLQNSSILSIMNRLSMSFNKFKNMT